jgi:hypothetical protein
MLRTDFDNDLDAGDREQQPLTHLLINISRRRSYITYPKSLSRKMNYYEKQHLVVVSGISLTV